LKFYYSKKFRKTTNNNNSEFPGTSEGKFIVPQKTTVFLANKKYGHLKISDSTPLGMELTKRVISFQKV